jgi:hypothetical protein
VPDTALYPLASGAGIVGKHLGHDRIISRRLEHDVVHVQGLTEGPVGEGIDDLPVVGAITAELIQGTPKLGLASLSEPFISQVPLLNEGACHGALFVAWSSHRCLPRCGAGKHRPAGLANDEQRRQAMRTARGRYCSRRR